MLSGNEPADRKGWLKRVLSEKAPALKTDEDPIIKFRKFSCSTMQRQLATRIKYTKSLEKFSECLYASVCLADISGFTRLSARLSAEELKVHINEYFKLLLTVVRQNHGDVIKFLGDAVLILWPVDKDASEDVQAAATIMACLCALQLLKDCGNYDRGEGENKVELRLHCGVVCGLIHTMCVGEADRWEYIVSGEPLKAVGEAESEASTGECCLSPEAYAKVSEHFEAVLMPKGSYRLTGVLKSTSYISIRYSEVLKAQLAHAEQMQYGEKERPVSTRRLVSTVSDVEGVANSSPTNSINEKYDGFKNPRRLTTRSKEDFLSSPSPQDGQLTILTSGLTPGQPCSRPSSIGKESVMSNIWSSSPQQLDRPMSLSSDADDTAMSVISQKSSRISGRFRSQRKVRKDSLTDEVDLNTCKDPFPVIRRILDFYKGILDVKIYLNSFLKTDDDDDDNGDNEIMHIENFRPALRCFVHVAARAAIENGTDAYLPELRNVVTIFVEILEMDIDLNKGLLDRPQRALTMLLDVLKRFEGSLRQYVVDDKGCVMIAAFGLPDSSHEDNCVRAVEVAVELRPRFTKLGIKSRIGISEGKVYCGVVGCITDRCEYAMMGCSVNLAARLMGKCNANDILVSETVHEGATAAFTFLELEKVQAKGYAKPVRVFRPVERANNASQLIDKAKDKDFVGRHEQLKIFQEAFKRLASESITSASMNGRNNHSLRHGNHAYIIQGGPGSGKTRLAGEVLKIASKNVLNMNPVVANASAASISTPYFVIRQLLEQIFSLKLGRKLVGTTRDKSIREFSILSLQSFDNGAQPLGGIKNSRPSSLQLRKDSDAEAYFLGSTKSEDPHPQVDDDPVFTTIKTWLIQKNCFNATLDEHLFPGVNDNMLAAADGSIDLEGLFRPVCRGSFVSHVTDGSPSSANATLAHQNSDSISTADVHIPLLPRRRSILLDRPMLLDQSQPRRVQLPAGVAESSSPHTVIAVSRAVAAFKRKIPPKPPTQNLSNISFAPSDANMSIITRLLNEDNADGVREGLSTITNHGQLHSSDARRNQVPMSAVRRFSNIMTSIPTMSSLSPSGKSNAPSQGNVPSPMIIKTNNMYIRSHSQQGPLTPPNSSNSQNYTLANLIPLLGEVLPVRFHETSVTKAMSPKERRRIAESLMLRLLLIGVDEGYNVILVDNLHLVDSFSSRVLLRLIRAMKRGIFLGTRRKIEMKDQVTISLRVDPIFEVFTKMCFIVDLPKLSLTDVKKMMKYVITEKYLQMSSVDVLSDYNVQKLHERGLGSPLHCLALSKELRHALAQKRFTSIDDLPALAHNEIVSRFDQLNEAGKVVLKTAAIIGERFLEQELRYTLETLEHENCVKVLDACLEKFVEDNLITLDTQDDETPVYVFCDHVQESVYNLMIGTVREKCHGVVAEYMENYYYDVPERFDDIIHHYMLSDVLSKKVQYVLYGAVKANEEFRHVDTCRYYGMLIKLATGFDPDDLLKACCRKVTHEDSPLVHAEYGRPVSIKRRGSESSNMSCLDAASLYMKTRLPTWIFRDHVAKKLQILSTIKEYRDAAFVADTLTFRNVCAFLAKFAIAHAHQGNFAKCNTWLNVAFFNIGIKMPILKTLVKYKQKQYFKNFLIDIFGQKIQAVANHEVLDIYLNMITLQACFFMLHCFAFPAREVLELGYRLISKYQEDYQANRELGNQHNASVEESHKNYLHKFDILMAVAETASDHTAKAKQYVLELTESARKRSLDSDQDPIVLICRSILIAAYGDFKLAAEIIAVAPEPAPAMRHMHYIAILHQAWLLMLSGEVEDAEESVVKLYESSISIQSCLFTWTQELEIMIRTSLADYNGAELVWENIRIRQESERRMFSPSTAAVVGFSLTQNQRHQDAHVYTLYALKKLTDRQLCNVTLCVMLFCALYAALDIFETTCTNQTTRKLFTMTELGKAFKAGCHRLEKTCTRFPCVVLLNQSIVARYYRLFGKLVDNRTVIDIIAYIDGRVHSVRRNLESFVFGCAFFHLERSKLCDHMGISGTFMRTTEDDSRDLAMNNMIRLGFCNSDELSNEEIFLTERNRSLSNVRSTIGHVPFGNRTFAFKRQASEDTLGSSSQSQFQLNAQSTVDEKSSDAYRMMLLDSDSDSQSLSYSTKIKRDSASSIEYKMSTL